MGQDNKVPKVIQNFISQPSSNPILSFLSFEDWLGKKGNEAKDWILVAQSWDDGATDSFTFSVLTRFSKNNLKTILSISKWDVNLHIGRPMFNKHGENGFVYYGSEQPDEFRCIEFFPFTIHREFHGYIPNTFELVQDFILYHEAFYVPEVNEYHHITDDGEIQPVVRFIREKSNEKLFADAHHLKDYLAARGCCLIRYHDHRRFSSADVSKYINKDGTNYKYKDDTSAYEIWVNHNEPMTEYTCLSRLLGKDVVLPYPEPDKKHAELNLNGKFVTFIVGRDEKGSEVEATCDEDSLSNYFTDRGTPHFLTPVFFGREVLGKYYQEPRRYSINNSYLNCLHLWDIPFDTTSEGLIQVWLGDLGRIPYKEQLHWRQFNVAPRGDITKHRWLRDFMAEFANPNLEDDPIAYFYTAFNNLQKKSKSKYGEEFFLELSDKDKHAYETLHMPLTEEWKEFDEQIQAIAKVTVDSLNVELLSRECGAKIDGKVVKGSIDLLGMFLEQFGVGQDQIKQILFGFQTIQTLRSTGAAHRKGSKFEQAIQKYGLADISNFEKFKKITLEIIKSLSFIIDLLRQGTK
jgi:hypothetical protein